MKEKMIYGFLMLFLATLVGAPVLHAEEEVGEVWEQAGEDDADPSAFEGDSESMPGERAPENLSMDDAPGGGGIAIE